MVTKRAPGCQLALITRQAWYKSKAGPGMRLLGTDIKAAVKVSAPISVPISVPILKAHPQFLHQLQNSTETILWGALTWLAACTAPPPPWLRGN